MTTIQDAIGLFLDHRRLGGRAVGTLQLYARQLALWHTWRTVRAYVDDIAQVDIVELRAFFAYLRQEHIPFGAPSSPRPPRPGRLAESGVAAHWRTLRAFWRFLDAEELLLDPQKRFFQRIEPPRLKKTPRPACDHTTLDRLLTACGDGTNEESARNRAIVLLLAESGMRIAELCGLTDRQVVLRKRRARLRGKGEKWRTVFWRATGAAALLRYLMLRRGVPYDDISEAPLLRGCSHRNNGAALTPDLVRSLIKRIADDAGVKLPYGAPLHFFRHGFAHDAIAAGADISEVSQLMGHASITTTMEYLRDEDDRLQDAYDRIFRQRPTSRKARPDAEEAGG